MLCTHFVNNYINCKKTRKHPDISPTFRMIHFTIHCMNSAKFSYCRPFFQTNSPPSELLYQSFPKCKYIFISNVSAHISNYLYHIHTTVYKWKYTRIYKKNIYKQDRTYQTCTASLLYIHFLLVRSSYKFFVKRKLQWHVESVYICIYIYKYIYI